MELSVKDRNKRKEWAKLYYDPGKKLFNLVIDKAADVKQMPASLWVYASSGKYDLSHADSLDWVKDRIIPEGRQNIQSILRNAKMDEYDEFKMLRYTKGKCVQDDLYVSMRSI
jgi:ABC-type ATPase with predicted acetyltransferase domain